MYQFDYHRPKNLDQAKSLLGGQEDPKLLAGGQTLLPTMKQRLVTAKNRKLRLLHQLYPDVQCKLMYRKDIENMGIKYGLFGEQGPPPDARDRAGEETEINE